ncbi:MAG TPA: MFS transporter [Candidatus Deferrimicrobium sp.]|nr:MFS transporter [Candidatus Deferrimicrobium sp.]
MIEGKSNRSSAYILLACWLGWLITASGRQVSDIVKNEMEVALGLTSRLQVSIVIDLSFWVGYIITALVLGIISDRIGRKRIIYISLILFSIPTGLIFLSTPTTFIIIRFFQGLAVGGFFPVAVALLGDIHEVKERSKAVARFVSGGVFGAIIGWLVAGIIYDAVGSWQMGFVIFVPPIITIGLVNYFLIEESPKVIGLKEKPSVSAIETIKSLLKNRFLIIALLFCGLDLFTLWLVDDWIPYYVKEIFLISSTEAAIFRAASAFAGIIGILFFGYYSDKFGRRRSLIIAVIGGLASTISLLLVSVLKLSFIYMYPLSAAVGFFALGEFAAIYVLVMENAPDNRYGAAMGLCIFIGNAIALTGGPLAAVLSDYTLLGLHAFLIVPLIALALRLPLSLIAKDPAFISFGEKPTK